MVNAMTRYADDRARYDTTYIRDAYESVEAASSQFKLPPNTTWPDVATALRDVRACLSIDANSTCKIQPDARDAFGTYASKVRLQVDMASDVVEAFASEADAYQQRVEGAFDNRLRGVVRYRRDPGRRRRLSSAGARGLEAAASDVALCREVEGHWSGARPRGVGRAVGAVAAGFGVRAPLIV